MTLQPPRLLECSKMRLPAPPFRLRPMQDNGVSAVGNGKSLIKRHKFRGSGKSATGAGENRRRVPEPFAHPSFIRYNCVRLEGIRTAGAVGMTPDWRALVAVFGVIVLVSTASDLAAAADLPQQAPNLVAYTPPVPDWIVTIGAEFRAVPAWPGAPDNKIALAGLPLFSVRHAGEPPPYFGPRDSFGFDVIDLGQLKFGPAIKIVGERKAADYAATVGLGNIGYTLQAGAFAEYWPVQWLRLRTEVRQGFGGEGGTTGDAFLDAVVPFGRFRWSAGPRVTLKSAPDQSLFRHHHRTIDWLGAGRPAAIAGLSRRRRPLFLRRRHAT